MVERWLEVMVGPGIGSGKGCPPEEATGIHWIHWSGAAGMPLERFLNFIGG